MSQIKVELLDYMGDDLRVSNVARVSFAKWKEEFDDKDARLIHYLAAHAHTSPFRHTSIQLRCEAPVFLARQLVKHCIGLTWNEVSRRYVDADIEFYTPDSWRSRPTDGIKQGSGEEIVPDHKLHISSDTAANYLTPKDCMQVCLEVYKGMLKEGVAPEMARMVLPQSLMTTWIWTGSLQAFFHVYELRSGGGAQVEAQEFAQKLKDVIQPLFPHCFEALEENAKTH